MSRSSDPGHFFQTEQSLNDASRKAAKAGNVQGHPVKLPSKILAVIPDPEDEAAVFVAESAGTARRIKLDQPNAKPPPSYRGPSAPLTSLALSPDTRTLYAGCWDKSIWSWDVSSRAPGPRFAGGHTDFVKTIAIVALHTATLLVSGGADAYVVVWDTATAQRLHVLRGHARGVLDIALELSPAGAATAMLWSASSDRALRRWRVERGGADAIPVPFAAKDDGAPAEEELVVHETSVNRVRVVAGAGVGGRGVVLLTASSDKSAKVVEQDGAGMWAATATLEHPDFVRDAAVVGGEGLVATACRDEEVRLWDLEAAEEPVAVLEGHFEEVTGLCASKVGGETVVVSVGIDGTVRRWPGTREGVERWRREGERERSKGVEDVGAEETKGGDAVMTADEERELEELMMDDE